MTTAETSARVTAQVKRIAAEEALSPLELGELLADLETLKAEYETAAAKMEEIHGKVYKVLLRSVKCPLCRTLAGDECHPRGGATRLEGVHVERHAIARDVREKVKAERDDA